MMKLLRRGKRVPRLAVPAVVAAASSYVSAAVLTQPRIPHAAHGGHRASSAAAVTNLATDGEQSLLDLDDTRFFLTRIGFAPNHTELVQYAGLTRAQAVDKALASVRGEATTPPPDWMLEAIPTRIERNAWTADQRREQQKRLGQRYELLRAWWVREMLDTPSPLTERMTLFWHNHFTSGQDKVQYPQLMARQNLLLREHALGNFGALLHDVAKDPAMLLYLDGASNRKGNPTRISRAK